ncbi:MAG: 6-bladed beta-propeller [Candidatus Aminicenantes bacterium]|nr:MAG: 6-bladed beta-propeller [Candidatus Aminicenantes bacterium]
MKKKSIFAISFLLILTVFISCSQKKTEWKGTIEEENGVTVVRNPKEPLYGEEVFSLEEDLTLGKKEGSEGYLFERIRNIDIDKNENIYVLDSRAVQIKIFDKNGEPIRTFGSEGQGPGEMQNPQYMQITSKGEVMVYDPGTRRFLFFSMEGKYLRQTSIAKIAYPLAPIKLDSRGELIAVIVPPPPVGGIELKKFDSNLDLLMKISETEKDDSYLRREREAWQPDLLCVVTQNDNIVWAYPKKYEFHVLNPEGKLIRKIIKDHEPVKVTEEDKERLVERYERLLTRLPMTRNKIIFPNYFPAFMDISVDEKGRIFLRTYERVKDKESFFYFDVFNSEGKYIAKVLMLVSLNRPFVWKKNKLYTIEEDEEGFQMVKRYEVTWKVIK